MFYLKLFGSPTLEAESTTLTGRPVQRHRLALLALLALAPGRRLTRDKLIAYLWPERDGERGRNLLKQATYVLRGELGEQALLSENDELKLNVEAVEADVVQFEAALASSDFGRAVQLYRGPLLDGFFLTDAPEFEQWVEQERARCAQAYASALETLAVAAEAERDFGQAVEWWKRAAAHNPHDSRVAARLIQALAASGSRALALQHAAIHQHLLEQEFGIEPPAEITQLVEALRKRSEPRPQPVPATSKGDTPPTIAPVFAARRPRWRSRLVATSAGIMVLAAFAWAVRPRAADPAPSVAVLPFVNLSADSGNAWFSDGLTEEIITQLSLVDGLKVISRTSSMHYKGSKKPLREIADELGVVHVLEGSVRRDSTGIRITAQLIDARNDHHVWAQNFEFALDDGLRAQEQIARAVTRALELQLQQPTEFAGIGTGDPVAHDFYRRGRYFWNMRTREAHEQAVTNFQRAIEHDSSFADAWGALANTYITGYQLGYSRLSEEETYSRMKWAAERAIALNDKSAEAHTALSSVLWWQRNWPGAERELRRALELNPGEANTRSWHAQLLAGMGRLPEALIEIRRAHEQDPFAIIVTLNHGWICFLLKDYDCAAVQQRKAIETNQEWAPSFIQLAVTLAQQGLHEEARVAALRAAELAPRSSFVLADLALVYARAGRHADAREQLKRAKGNRPDAFKVARAHVALNEPDSALVWLERAPWQFTHRAVRWDPVLDPLRSDARFQQLVTRIDREMGMR